MPEISAYHSQQAAEKSLKAFLSVSSVPFAHTHDLVQLEAQCESVDPAFAEFIHAAQILTPYATLFRYPGGPLEPPLMEAENALQLARELLDFVRQRL